MAFYTIFNDQVISFVYRVVNTCTEIKLICLARSVNVTDDASYYWDIRVYECVAILAGLHCTRTDRVREQNTFAALLLSREWSGKRNSSKSGESQEVDILERNKGDLNFHQWKSQEILITDLCKTLVLMRESPVIYLGLKVFPEFGVASVDGYTVAIPFANSCRNTYRGPEKNTGKLGKYRPYFTLG